MSYVLLPQMPDDEERGLQKTCGYRCSLCPRVCQSRSVLKKHENWHKNIYPYHCSLCDKGFMSTTALRGHWASHTGYKEFKCEFCAKEYRYKCDLKEHKKSVHGLDPSSSQSSEPGYCQSVIWDTPSQCSGILPVSDPAYSLVSDSGYSVSDSGYSQSVIRDTPTFCGRIWKRHKYHQSAIDKPASNKLLVLCLRKSFTVPAEECQKDVMTAGTPAVGRLHTADEWQRDVMTTEDSCTCNVCGKPFRSKSGWKTHMDAHRGIFRVFCSFCQKGFYNEENLRGHLVTHTGRKEYRCHLCSKEYRYKKDYVIHLEKKHSITSASLKY
ncbi:hypothetical protein LSH36_223g04037 [Paralvinella palmiformis]|uniref:C2H2-type domain-containing protein n=1 Tax=Paralvinella palmiformis TaxID=53620 RepID=A0AAD9N3R7_9ANNE|nr:hypothetical protein LSH36_223g04037 [Paralvinella palmiformis]